MIQKPFPLPSLFACKVKWAIITKNSLLLLCNALININSFMVEVQYMTQVSLS